MEENSKFHYLLHLADNVLILGHRLSEWCGHGPVLEQDIAMTNISLDLIGQARMYFQYAAEIEGKGNTEDDLAYLRDGWDFKNVLLVEHANGDWGQTIVRQFLFDAFHHPLLVKLLQSTDDQIAAIAEKSLKEVTYHLRYSSEWMIRLGQGTAESHRRMQAGIDNLWMYTGELFQPAPFESAIAQHGIGPDLAEVQHVWQKKVDEVFLAAGLQKPDGSWMQSGGKEGRHTEQHGFILAELQWMQRAYPGLEW